MNGNAFAIDIGYGNTKYASINTATGAIRPGHFPSITPHWHGSGLPKADYSNYLAKVENWVLPIAINGVTYAVGKASRNHLMPDYTRDRTPDFATTDEYMALLHGAMAGGRAPKEISALAVGLPVAFYRDDSRREGLRKLMIGRHKIGEETWTVRSALVLPQPMGAYIDLMEREASVTMEGIVAVVDVGYYTSDWIVTRDGELLLPRCGGHSGGVSAFLQEVARQFEVEHGEGIPEYSELDEALRSDAVLGVGPKKVDLKPYLPSAHAKNRNAVRAIKDKLGGMPKIDRIILAGGGANLFKQAMDEAFPDYEIVMGKSELDSMYANVRGFARAAMHRLAKMKTVDPKPTERVDDVAAPAGGA